MTATVERLAVLVVYFLRDDTDLPLVQLHLDRLARHTHVPYTIYAVANRATAATRELLHATPHVEVCNIPETELRGNREHAHYLDGLLARALDDGATHIATLDMDSFPVHDAWTDILLAAAPGDSGLAGILRAENGDVALPHPSCTFARRDFFERFRPSFSPDSDFTPEFRRFLRTTGQGGDTGIRLGYVCWSARIPWGPLLRSNVNDLHYLIAGVYGDAVFHLGAVTRGAILFRRDLEHSFAHRVSTPIDRFPVRRPTAVRMKRAMLRRIRRGAEQRIIRRNDAIATVVRSWLLAEPDALLSYLRGTGPAPADPDWLGLLAEATTLGTGPPGLD